MRYWILNKAGKYGNMLLVHWQLKKNIIIYDHDETENLAIYLAIYN